MNSNKVKFIQSDTQNFRYDPDGISIGKTIYNNLEITFICCRKNGVPIGPEYAWYSNGNKFYTHYWSKNHQGKLLSSNTWNIDGTKMKIYGTNQCPICYDSLSNNKYIFFPCNHNLCLSCYQKLDNSQCVFRCKNKLDSYLLVHNSDKPFTILARNLLNASISLIQDHKGQFGIIQNYVLLKNCFSIPKNIPFLNFKPIINNLDLEIITT